MSSTTSASGLSRARSLRKPTKTETTSVGGEMRNVSPSRLPVKGQTPGQTSGQMSGAASATRMTRSATAGVAATKSSRPLSGVFARITSASSRQREKDSSGPGPEPSPPGRPTRAASIRQSSVSTRSSTGAPITRPTTSSGVPTLRRVASGASTAQGPDAGPGSRHARAKSSVTTLSSTTTLRPPSQSSTTTNTTAPDRSRPPLTSFTRRTPAGPTPPSPTTTTTPRRPLSISSLPGPPKPSQPGKQLLNKPLPRPPSQSSTTSTATTATTTTTTAPKPAFTTHQQTYTPLKPPGPRPATAAFLAPPSPSKLPANVALSAETARLQAELLQLHLLHRGAGPACASWAGSAREGLRARWEGVASAAEAVSVVEGGVEEGRAAAVLLGWGGGGGLGLEEKVAVLDGVVSGLWGVVGEQQQLTGGRYERVVRGFEAWAGQVERVVDGRRRRRRQRQRREEQDTAGNDAEPGEDENMFIPAPSPAWKAEHAALFRRVDEWRRKLRELGDAPRSEDGEAPSSLGRILAGCRALLDGMLAELELMEQIEREAAADEMAWVREMNRQELRGMDEGAPRPTAGAIWRVL